MNAPNLVPDDRPDPAQTVQIVRELAEVFRPERYVHLAMTIVSALAVLASTVIDITVHRADLDPIVLTGLLGSGGAMAWSVGQVLRMWNDALRLTLQMATHR